jgi:hypothetical protein
MILRSGALRIRWSVTYSIFAGSGASRQFTIDTFDNPDGPSLPESEDCLYVNVYAPSDASPTNQKPVLFWIYGVCVTFDIKQPMTHEKKSLIDYFLGKFAIWIWVSRYL